MAKTLEVVKKVPAGQRCCLVCLATTAINSTLFSCMRDQAKMSINAKKSYSGRLSGAVASTSRNKITYTQRIASKNQGRIEKWRQVHLGPGDRSWFFLDITGETGIASKKISVQP
jgi:hypothetical protein